MVLEFFFHYHFFLQSNFHVVVIHELGVHLGRGEKLLVNIELDQTISSVCAYIESLRCCPVMH